MFHSLTFTYGMSFVETFTADSVALDPTGEEAARRQAARPFMSGTLRVRLARRPLKYKVLKEFETTEIYFVCIQTFHTEDVLYHVLL